MSIRIKLMITYAVLVLVSAAVIVFSGIGIFTSVLTEVSESVLEDTNIKSITGEVINLLADLKHAEKYEPDQLIEETFVNEISDAMTFYNGGIVVKYDNQVIKSNGLNVSEAFYDKLEPMHTERQHESYIEENDVRYFFIDYTFDVSGEEVVYYFIINVTDMSNVKINVGEKLFRAFVVVILIVVLPILWIITRDITHPLKQLSVGVDHIKEGDLSFELHTRKKNEIGSVIKSFETMRQRLKISIDRQLKFEDNRKELITSISHDLKTPITSIKGHVEGIRDGVANTPEKLEKYLDIIYQKSNDMDQLIDDLFLFSKLDVNKLPFEMRAVPVQEFISEIIQEMAFDFSEDNEHINFKTTINEPIEISIDPMQMKRVIVNIIQNSMKYMDKSEKIIDVTLNDLNDRIQIIIADNGQGIDEDHLEFVFDRFYRVDESRNPETGGTGLGLAISKQIVDQHNGHIRAYSKPGEGTKMVIELKKEVKHD